MRYGTRRIINNRSRTYKRILEEKGVPAIRHYKTPKLKHLSLREKSQLKRIRHVWKMGDRYYKLAYRHYGDPKYWWVIAWYNRKPTEAHVEVGKVIYVPLPLEKVLRFLGI
ncbi:hypothetical protein CMI37_10985 [Candidatus Pacearchaeota archaeon]|nr:hypothetical protein [Candidatus Pacearchaeota archaeon]|tara:strand:+ start:60 stop:392 length:333 start_codon:yes stop_codon:yes gene_type:complete